MTEAGGVEPDYYMLLGVEASADWRAIDAAYYRRASELKASMFGDQAAFARAFAQLNAAYAVLNDGERRAAYDLTSSTGRPKVASASQTARSRFGWLRHRTH